MSSPPAAGPPHRFPFVLMDRALEGRVGDARALRLVSSGDALCEGAAGTSFAQSLLIEAMAQAAKLLAGDGLGARAGLLAGLSRVSFGRPPSPGDRLTVEARLSQRFGGMIRVSGRVTVGDETLAQGDILISLQEAGEWTEGGDE